MNHQKVHYKKLSKTFGLQEDLSWKKNQEELNKCFWEDLGEQWMPYVKNDQLVLSFVCSRYKAYYRTNWIWNERLFISPFL